MNKNIDGIKGYFTEEIKTSVREMSHEDMIAALKSLEGTPYWFAILKYTQERVAVIQDSFLILDPVKEPSKISQYQGAISGMLDLQDAVLSLKFESKKSENPKYKDEKMKEDNGGAYGVI